MKRILIVDDDPAVTNYLMVFLMQTGLFETDVVNDSRDVTGLFDTEAFDIVLLDMDMPLMDGRKTLAAVRKARPGVKVVAFSGTDLPADGWEEPPDAFLPKPSSPEKLLKTLKKVLPS